MKTQNR